MKIEGIQKLTLLDYPGKVACTVFLGGCNLRCPFCHNSEIAFKSEPKSGPNREELLAFLRKRKNILDGVCVSGGEPLLSPETEELISEIKKLGYLVKLDTNGFFPKRLKALVAGGLVDYVAMDVKNSFSRYALTTGIPNLNIEPFKESLSFLFSDTVDYELRTTVVREFHDKEAFKELSGEIPGAKRFFLQCFVDSPGVSEAGLHAYGREEMEGFAEILRPFVKSVSLRGL